MPDKLAHNFATQRLAVYAREISHTTFESIFSRVKLKPLQIEEGEKIEVEGSLSGFCGV